MLSRRLSPLIFLTGLALASCTPEIPAPSSLAAENKESVVIAADPPEATVLEDSFELPVSAESTTFVAIESPLRQPDESFEEAHARYLASIGGSDQNGVDGLALSGTSPRNAARRLSQGLSRFSGSSTSGQWTMPQLRRGFSSIRDTPLSNLRFRNQDRRLTWLYPDDGCFARSVMAVKIAEQKERYPSPMSIWIFGNLSVSTTNHPSGTVNWGYHVAPVVEVAGTWYVIDPAIDPRNIMPVRGWVERMTSDPDNALVAICHGNAVNPNGDCGASTDFSAAAISVLNSTYVPAEWTRQEALGRNASTVLGNRPPWAD